MQRILVSIREASQLLSVSPRTLHRYVQLKIIPCVRVGRRKLVRAEDLERFAQHGVSVEALRELRARK